LNVRRITPIPGSTPMRRDLLTRIRRFQAEVKRSREELKRWGRRAILSLSQSMNAQLRA